MDAEATVPVKLLDLEGTADLGEGLRAGFRDI